MVFPLPQKITTPFILDFSFFLKLLAEISNKYLYSAMKTARDIIGCHLKDESLVPEPPVYCCQVLVENLFTNLKYSQTKSIEEQVITVTYPPPPGGGGGSHSNHLQPALGSIYFNCSQSCRAARGPVNVNT
jgi:hypothetical protein